MKVRFANADLDRLETDASFTGGFQPEVVKGFRKVMQVIRAAADERDFYAMRSLHFEKLKGDRANQRSLRLNIKWRLIVEIESADPKNIVVIVDIENHYGD